MHVADLLMMSRLRYLATRGGMALAVRRCVTGIYSNCLGVAFLVDFQCTSVNRCMLRFAAACMASRKACYRDAQETLYRPEESSHIDRVFRFALHLHSGNSTNKVVNRRTKLRNCETMSTYVVQDVDKKTTWADVCKNVCQKSTLADLHETIHGTACGMYAMYLKQLSSYPCPSGEELLETLNVTESESTRWRDSFELCGVRPGFWRGRGQDETHRKGCEHTQFVLVVVCLAGFTALAPLHRETPADVRRLFVRDLLLQDERTIAKTIHS